MVWERVCPHCGGSFSRRIFGINLLHLRVERCPHCKRWAKFNAFSGESTVEARERDTLVRSEEEILSERIEESRFE
jgi:hypothetical protein